MSPIDQSRVVRLLRGWWQLTRAPRHPRAPLLTFEMVTPPVREGWLGRGGQWLWHRVAVAAAGSRTAELFSKIVAAVQSPQSETRIAQRAWMVAIAAVTNLLMLTVVERYHFPRRTALVLPAIAAVAALLVVAMSSAIARAAADKRDE